MSYETPREAAAMIRAAYKAKGWTPKDVSVTSESYSGGSSIRIRIKNPKVDIVEAKKIAKGKEKIRYCDYSGEILAGGNRYVSIDYSGEAEKALSAPYIDAVRAALAEIGTTASGNALIPILDSGVMVGKARDREWAGTLWSDDEELGCGCKGEFTANTEWGIEHGAFRVALLSRRVKKQGAA